MPIYRHNNTVGSPIYISDFVAATIKGVLGGPYPILHGKANVTNNLVIRGTLLSPIDNDTDTVTITRAFGLISCAAVIYHSTDPLKTVAGAWVHHAPSGQVTIADVDIALRALGTAAKTVEVIFAHPKDEDSGYAQSIETIISMGVLEENVVEIPNVMGAVFGIDNLGRIG